MKIQIIGNNKLRNKLSFNNIFFLAPAGVICLSALSLCSLVISPNHRLSGYIMKSDSTHSIRQ